MATGPFEADDVPDMCYVHSVGWLISRDERCIKIAQDKWFEGGATYRTTLTIPMLNVISEKELS